MLNVYFYLFVQCFVFTECYAWTRYLWDVCEWHNDAKAVLNKRAREYVVSVSARVYECMGDCVFNCCSWRCWSSCCIGTHGRRRWGVPAWHTDNPRTRLPAADRYTPEDHRSLPADTSRRVMLRMSWHFFVITVSNHTQTKVSDSRTFP